MSEPEAAPQRRRRRGLPGSAGTRNISLPAAVEEWNEAYGLVQAGIGDSVTDIARQAFAMFLKYHRAKARGDFEDEAKRAEWISAYEKAASYEDKERWAAGLSPKQWEELHMLEEIVSIKETEANRQRTRVQHRDPHPARQTAPVF